MTWKFTLLLCCSILCGTFLLMPMFWQDKLTAHAYGKMTFVDLTLEAQETRIEAIERILSMVTKIKNLRYKCRR